MRSRGLLVGAQACERARGRGARVGAAAEPRRRRAIVRDRLLVTREPLFEPRRVEERGGGERRRRVLRQAQRRVVLGERLLVVAPRLERARMAIASDGIARVEGDRAREDWLGVGGVAV